MVTCIIARVDRFNALCECWSVKSGRAIQARVHGVRDVPAAISIVGEKERCGAKMGNLGA